MAAVAVAAGLTLAACGGSDINSSAGGGSTSGADCGVMNMAINPWVGYEASAYVVGQVAATKLGCTVNYKDLKEEVAWQGFASGDVDVVIENWGHPDLEKKYIDQQSVAVDVGSQGNEGIIGWYIPPWLAEAHPDIVDNWENLNNYASDFATAETQPKGQLLDGDPSYVTNDEALVNNLNLDFQVVYAGSEAALIQAFRKAEQNQEFLLGYFYEPQWFLSEVPLVKVNLPPYTDGCDADPAKVACDYPPYPLNKVAATKFMDSGSPAATLVQNFTWTNDDQNSVAKAIADEGMSPEDAAQQWIDANPDAVDAWLQGT
ncbi:MAG: ABC transporter substrate-binding protein [Actinobacteria bacterium]|nr:ABC transporter substrate-binding protein [Actinomycetota bacterium]